MTAGRIIVKNIPAIDADGNTVAGAELRAYEAGTTTPKPLYTNVGLTIPHTYPIVADINGQFPTMYAAVSTLAVPNLYRITVYSPAGIMLPGGSLDDVEASVSVVNIPDFDPGVTVNAFGEQVLSYTTEDEFIDDVGLLRNDLTNFVGDAADGANFLADIEANALDIIYDPIAGNEVQRNVRDKLREHISIDDYDTIEDAISVIERPFGSFYKGSNRVYLPAKNGEYTLAGTLDIKTTTFIEGDSGGQDAGQATVIQAATNATAIRVQSYNTTGLTTEVSPTTGGDNSTFKHLSLFGDGADTGAHGFHIRGRAQIEHCYVLEFGGNGLYGSVTAGSGGATDGNANCCWVAHGRYILNGLWGAYLDGADFNAGVFSGLDFSNNGSGGLYDSSFLGNLHLGHHTAVNGGPSYKADSVSARGVMVGCYVESGQDPPEIVAPWLVLGGFLAEYVANEGGPGLYASAGLNAIVSGVGIGSNETVSGGVCKTILGGDPTVATIMYLQHTVVSASLAFRWKWSSLLSTADIYFDWANSGSARPIKITGPSTAFTGGRASAVGAGQVDFLQGVWLGPASERFLGTSSGAPTGEAAKGDTWLDITANAGGKAGYRCTTSGTIGSTAVIKQWGAIDA